MTPESHVTVNVVCCFVTQLSRLLPKTYWAVSIERNALRGRISCRITTFALPLNLSSKIVQGAGFNSWQEHFLPTHECLEPYYYTSLYTIMACFTERAGVLLTLEIRIWEVLGLNRDKNARHTDVLRGFIQCGYGSADIIPRSDLDRFLSSPLQIIIHLPSYHRTLYRLATHRVLELSNYPQNIL
jgi:hypothetical protein